MKGHSIRFKFFAAISAVALVFIGVLLLLNLFFYEDYYMLTRRGELRDAYQSMRGSYTGNVEDIAAVLDSYESRSAIRLSGRISRRLTDGMSPGRSLSSMVVPPQCSMYSRCWPSSPSATAVPSPS